MVVIFFQVFSAFRFFVILESRYFIFGKIQKQIRRNSAECLAGGALAPPDHPGKPGKKRWAATPEKRPFGLQTAGKLKYVLGTNIMPSLPMVIFVTNNQAAVRIDNVLAKYLSIKVLI